MRLLRVASFLVVLGCLTLGQSGFGQERKKPSVSQFPPRAASTLTELARELRSLPARPSLVAVTSLKMKGRSTGSSSDLTPLGERIGDVLGAQVPGQRQRLAYPQTPSAARSRARQLGLALVLLQPSLVAGRLLVTVDLTEWPQNVWERARLPKGTVTEHLSLSRAADEEIRQFLPRPERLFSKRQIFAGPTDRVLALACGSLEPQGPQRLLIVGRHRVFLGRFRGAGFLPEAQASWDDLSPLSPNPLRAPLASAIVHPDGLLIGSSDRRDLLSLRPDLTVIGRSRSAYVQSSESGQPRCLPFSQTGLARTAGSCGVIDATPGATGPRPSAESIDMFASAALTDPQGTTSNFELAVTERDGELLVERPAATTLRQTIPGLGAQVALADLDGDSTMEIISSRATSSKEEDGILAHRIVDHGADLLAEVPTGPVSAVAVCPFDGENPLTVIAAVESELWVLR